MTNTVIKGQAYYGKITKQLLHKVPPHSIIIIEHEDLDIVASEDIVRKKVRAVINTRKSITGKLPRSGLAHLINNNIPVFDYSSSVQEFKSSMYIKVEKNKLLSYSNKHWKVIGSLRAYSEKNVSEKTMEGNLNFRKLFKEFAENSLYHSSMELTPFLQAVHKLPKLDDLEDYPVFVVARGYNVEEEIQSLHKLLFSHRCKIIAVDGAASLLMQYQINPDYVVGDMDSISNNVRRLNSRFIAHSYMNGDSPGQQRLKELSLDSITIPFPGLSEDLAIMLAYASGAAHIFTLGCRNSTVELVEKGRKGMGSTILTRMYAGEKISDCKSISKLFTALKGFHNIKDSLLEDPLSLIGYSKEYQIDES